MSSARLAALVDRLTSEQLGVHALTIVRHGTLVLDAAFYPFDGAEAHDIASCTKALTSLALGLTLASHPPWTPATPLATFFPAWAADAQKREITLRDALTMQSGLHCVSQPFEETLFAMQQAPDWTAFTLALPLQEAPGTVYRYCSPVAHLLSAAISNIEGRDAATLLETDVFRQLGIRDVVWPRDPQGIPHGWGDVRMRAADLARLGLLLLHRGEWDGTALLPARWVDEATRPQVQTGTDHAGYFFRPVEGGFVANGRGGQFLYVLPGLDLVVVTQGASGPEQEAAYGELAMQLLVPAVLTDDAVAEDPTGSASLQRALQRAASPPAESEPAAIPTLAATRYAFDPNPLGWRSFALTAGDGKTLLSVDVDGTLHALPVGLDGNVLITPNVRWTQARAPTRIALVGRWESDARFGLKFDTLEGIDAGSVTFTLAAETAEVVFSERTFLHGSLTLHARHVP